MKKLFILFIAIVMLTSCATVPISVGNKNLTYEKYVPNYLVIGHITLTVERSYIMGILKTDQVNLEKLFEKEIQRAGADAVINLKFIEGPKGFGNFLSIITLGIYTPKTLTITGDVISYKK